MKNGEMGCHFGMLEKDELVGAAFDGRLESCVLELLDEEMLS
jgi:hypothetical protein